MTSLLKIKNRLIDRILITKDEKLLNAIDTIFNSTHSDEKFPLDTYQIEMLLMSEHDILEGNLISAEELEKSDEKWMK
jgi:hypothetical protein